MAEPIYANGDLIGDTTLLRRRKLAEALMKSGADYSPVGHWAQGLARVANALMGGWQAGELDAQEKAGIAEQALRDNQMVGGLGLGGAVPSVAAPADTAGPARAATSPTALLPHFARAENQYGLPSNFLPQVANIESRFDPNAKNPKSSAAGLLQFTNGTAKQYGLTNPYDPIASIDAGARLASDNQNYLRRSLGRDPTPGELYLAHQQGAGGAAKLLANPSARAIDIVGRKAVLNNGGDETMTAAQFSRLWTRKVAENNADLPAPNAAVAESSAGQPGFYIPPGPAAQPMPAVDPMGYVTGADQAMPGQVQPQMAQPSTPSPGIAIEPIEQPQAPQVDPTRGQPLSPTFTAEGVAQPWMGTALPPAASPREAIARTLARTQTLPPPRPADLALPQADMPAPGAVPAIGQMQPSSQPSYGEIDPNAPDGGARLGQLASEEARRGQRSGAGVMNPFQDLALALWGNDRSQQALASGSKFASLAQALAPTPGIAAQGMPNGAQPQTAYAGGPGGAAPGQSMPSASQTGGAAPQAANPQLSAAYATIRSPYATMAQKSVAQTIINNAIKGASFETITRPDGSVWRVPKTGNGAPSQIFGPQSKPEERTGNAKEYDIYVAQEKAAGRTPDTFTTWERANKAAGSTNISIDTKGAQAFASRASELQAKRYGDMVDSGDAARGMQGDLDMLEGMMKGLQTGRGAEMRLSMAQFAKSFGFNDIADGLTGGKLGEMEAFSSMIDKLTPTMRQGMPGAASDRDVAMFRNALPNLLKTPEGNQILMQTLRSMNQYRMHAGDLAGQAMRGEISQGDADRRLRELESPFIQFRKYREESAKASGQSGAQTSGSLPGVSGQTRSGLKWSVQ